MRRCTTAALGVLAAGIALVLSGCDGGGGPAPSPTDSLLAFGGGGGGKGPGGSGSGGSGSSSGEGAQASGEAQPAASCPEGEWILDNGSWAEALEALWVAAAGLVDVEVSGELWLDWNADGGYTVTARPSEYVVSGESEGTAFTQTIRHEGTETGTWAAAGESAYRLVTVDDAAMHSTVTMEAGGFTYTPDKSELVSEAWAGTVQVACGLGVMTTTVTDESGSLSSDFVPRG